MNDKNVTVERCPYCGNENELSLKVEEDGAKLCGSIYCTACGKILRLHKDLITEPSLTCDCEETDEKQNEYYKRINKEDYKRIKKIEQLYVEAYKSMDKFLKDGDCHMAVVYAYQCSLIISVLSILLGVKEKESKNYLHREYNLGIDEVIKCFE